MKLKMFLHDRGNNLRNLSSNISTTSETTIVAETGVIEKNKMFLLNGQIISFKKNFENEVIKFEQLNIDLSNLSTTTIKKAKIQETSTFKLMSCLQPNSESKFCNKNFKKRNFTYIK